MATRQRHGEAGMTLLEITLAVAIFAVAVGITAQSLVSYYLTMDTQEQQIESAQAARSVVAAIRDKRQEFRGAADFPVGLVAWINQQQDAKWEDFLRTAQEGDEYDQLGDHEIEVTLDSLTGAAVVAGTNPVVVTVVSRWEDRRGRELTATVSTVITDE